MAEAFGIPRNREGWAGANHWLLDGEERNGTQAPPRRRCLPTAGEQADRKAEKHVAEME
jgi:hypothetical protein